MMQSEIRAAKREARRIWLRLCPRALGSDIPRVKGPNTSTHFRSDHCPDHWQNISIFGHCWKHNADGSLKPLFAQAKEV